MTNARPLIGVFDSGFGGLTVLRELLHHLPGADFLYLGDTAHLPYGSKSQAAVTRYTDAAIRELVSRGADLIVIACNTASALALPTLDANSPVPLVGVIKPGASAAADVAPRESWALVLATEGTCNSHAYTYACAAEGLLAKEKPCPLFVPLVEEGWTSHPVTEQVAHIYLEEALLSMEAKPQAIVLGCTHYPLLRPLLEKEVEKLGLDIPIVDSAEATARHTATLLPSATVPSDAEPKLHFLATDAAGKFQRFAPRFLGREIPTVELIHLDD
jgi:glutamate racemase